MAYSRQITADGPIKRREANSDMNKGANRDDKVMRELRKEVEEHTTPFLEYTVGLLQEEHSGASEASVKLVMMTLMFEEARMVLNTGTYLWPPEEIQEMLEKKRETGPDGKRKKKSTNSF
jgi:hypothetical protein